MHGSREDCGNEICKRRQCTQAPHAVLLATSLIKTSLHSWSTSTMPSTPFSSKTLVSSTSVATILASSVSLALSLMRCRHPTPSKNTSPGYPRNNQPQFIPSFDFRMPQIGPKRLFGFCKQSCDLNRCLEIRATCRTADCLIMLIWPELSIKFAKTYTKDCHWIVVHFVVYKS